MINNKTIGRKLKELRNSRGLRQSELADLVGLSRPAILRTVSTLHVIHAHT